MRKKRFFFEFKRHEPAYICTANFSGFDMFVSGRGKSLCSKDDKFDVVTGHELAQARSKVSALTKAHKTAMKRKADLEKVLAKINNNINQLDKMLESSKRHVSNIENNISKSSSK